jgi:hypothetical protein
MDDLTKTIIRIHHWVSHGLDHLQDYQKAADVLIQAGQEEAAAEMRRVVELEREATTHINRAADILGPPPQAGSDQGHVHSHPHAPDHDHVHDHEHTHGPDQAHSHEHAHPHDHPHDHDQAHDHDHEHAHDHDHHHRH